MKFVIFLALLGLTLAAPILNNSQEDVRILSDGSIVVSNGLGKRIFIQKSTETKGNLELVVKNSNGLNRVIEISSPTQIVKDVVKNSANIEITATVQQKPVDGKKEKTKGPVVNGEVQLKTLQTIVREFQGIIDTTTYTDLLTQINVAVTNGQLNQVILDAFRSINDEQKQVDDDSSDEVDQTEKQVQPTSQANPVDLWSQLQNYLPQGFGQNPAAVAQNQGVAVGQNPLIVPQSGPAFGAQNSYIKFGPGGPFGPFSPFNPYSPIWTSPNVSQPNPWGAPTPFGVPNPWVASNPWLQSNPWVANNPWIVPQTSTGADGQPGTDGQSDSVATFGAQNSFAVKFPALPAGAAPWWLATSAIDAQIKDAVKYQKTALKNLQQLQSLKLAQSTALAQATAAGDTAPPTIDYDSAIQSAYDVLAYAQKSVSDLSLQKQQQQLALLQFGQQPPVAAQQPAAEQPSAVGQQPTGQVPLNQAFFVDEKIEEKSQSQTQSDPSEFVPNPFTSFKVKPPKPTKAPKPIAEAPEIAQTKVAAVIQQRIQAIQDQWNQQNLVSQQLLQQQAQVTQQIQQLQDQLQLAKAQGASPLLQNQIQLAQQDLAARQGALFQQQLGQQALTNSLQTQLAALNDELQNVPNANIPEGASTWPEVLGIPAKAAKTSGKVTKIPLQGGLQSFTPAF